MRPLLLALPCLVAIACASEKDPAPATGDGWGGHVDLGVQGQVQELRHDFGTWDLAPGEEVSDLCFSWTLGNEAPLEVSAVELRNEGFWHHSNWFFVPEDMYAGPDGSWPCPEREFHELNAAIAGGVLYAQSTQAKYEVQKFAPGAAIELPAHARVIASAHLLNITTKTQHTAMRMRIFGIEPADVTVKLQPFRLGYHELTIPPHSKSRFVGQCEIASKYEGTVGRPLDMKLYYLLPHTHALGYNVTVQVVGGPHDGDVILSTVTNNFEANGKAFDPPYDLTGATGFRYWCAYDNPRDVQVGWGIGDQEMCEVLGYADSGMLFDAWTALKTPGQLVANVEETFGGHVPADAPAYTADCQVLPLLR
jgi:hypothetical protein